MQSDAGGRRLQPDIPGRPEAIRRLVEITPEGEIMQTCKMAAMKIRLLRHTSAPEIPDGGSYEVRFPEELRGRCGLESASVPASRDLPRPPADAPQYSVR